MRTLDVLFDGHSARDLGGVLHVPSIRLYDEIGSTMDVAHREAERGAEAGTVVLAERQTMGRGQHGRAWSSRAGAGVWLSVIERMTDTEAIETLSLRVGLHVAESLDAIAGATVRVKRPNDLYLDEGKLGGILCEARWHGATPGWVVVGLGVNTRRPEDVENAAALPEGVNRIEVLQAVVPAVRRAAAARGKWSAEEGARLDARELRRVVS